MGNTCCTGGSCCTWGGTQRAGGSAGGTPNTPRPPRTAPLTSCAVPGLGAAVALGAGERWGHGGGTPGQRSGQRHPRGTRNPFGTARAPSPPSHPPFIPSHSTPVYPSSPRPAPFQPPPSPFCPISAHFGQLYSNALPVQPTLAQPQFRPSSPQFLAPAAPPGWARAGAARGGRGCPRRPPGAAAPLLWGQKRHIRVRLAALAPVPR